MSAQAALRLSDERLVGQWADRRWRLHNLYWITDIHGRRIKFIPNEAQLDLLDELWFLNIILKSRQRGFCLDPGTLVLTDTLEWVPIGELRLGQGLVSIDEHHAGRRGAGRKMRAATVQAIAETFSKAYRITFDDGRSVICTGGHRWLSKMTNTEAKWRSIESPNKKKLRVGTKIRWITKPWGAATVEDGWFGGMLDGEGSMSRSSISSATVNVCQLRGPVWDRLIAYCEARGYSHTIEQDLTDRPSKYGKTPAPKIVFGRMDEMFRLIGQTRPTRFINRGWWENRDMPGKRSGIGWATIVDIEPLGARPMIDLQTLTGTFIAEGFVSHNSTFIDILGLDLAVFQANQSVGVIAHGLREASGIFKTKVIYPYNNLPAGIREAVYPVADSTQELSLSNGSSVYVGTSMRSATVQFLHVSEFGKISRRMPDKAKEIVSGSFNAVHPGQMIFVESTAEGRGGEFFDMCQTAMRRPARQPLTELDFRFHFYPWFTDPKNVLDPELVVVGDESERYFAELARLGIKLRPEQKAWYVKKAEQQGDHMKAEYPSTAKEAFEAAVDGFIFSKEMARARADGRICKVPLARGYPVNTFWDLGLSKTSGTTAIWCHQYVALQHRFLRSYEAHGQSLDHYVKWLQDTGYAFGVHFLPHDAGQRRLGKTDTKPWVQSLQELMPGHTFEVLPVIDEIRNGIDQTKAKFDECVFDEVGCEGGIKALDNYQYEWDESLGKFKDYPRHDWASNYADALRQWGQGWRPIDNSRPPPIPGYGVLDATVGM